MNIVCLMPTYGRTPQLLNNAVACFVNQTYKNKLLVILDDLGNLENCNAPEGIIIMSRKTRCASMGAKYNLILKTVTNWDAAAVWDDDDLYLPDYLSTHAAVLDYAEWSKPSEIITAYTNPPQRESAAGRFHGTLAISAELLAYVQGWENTRRGTFDQEFIAKLEKAAPVGRPEGRHYVYRWGSTQAMHSSGRIDEADYFKYKPQYTESISSLIAEYDDDSQRLIQYIKEHSL